MNEEAKRFKVGDVVRVRGESVRMTVESLGERSNEAGVVWFDSENQLRRTSIRMDKLEYADESSREISASRSIVDALACAGFEVTSSTHTGFVSLLDVCFADEVGSAWLVVIYWEEAGTPHSAMVAYAGDASFKKYGEGRHRRLRSAVAVWCVTVRSMQEGER